MTHLDTDEFTCDSVWDETGKASRRRGRGAAAFFRLPAYRSPFFPVFFYAGDTCYIREPSRWRTDDFLLIGQAAALKRVLRGLRALGDDLERSDDSWLAHAIRPLDGPENIRFFIHIEAIVTSFVHFLLRRLRPLSLFSRNHGSERNAPQKKEQLALCEETSAESSLPRHLHLLHPTDPLGSRSDSSCWPPSPSTSQTSSAESSSSPDVLLTTSCEEFTPDIAADEDEETYRFRCSCPGLYQCSATGLVFHMDGEGDVVYRTVPWNGRLLSQHHKRPAGPLFDITCVQQSVRQLHLPHCEILSTGGRHFLSAAHESDEGIEFITPHEVTERIIIDITGFSAFGNVKDEDSPPDPVRALVLLFYRPPADPDPTSVLNVLLLPRNMVLRDVLRTRKKLVGDESYIETSPHCKLQPEQEYALSTRPEDESVLVQPTEAEFDCDNYDNYFPSFQVNLEKIVKHVKLLLREANSSYSVWERRVCLSSSGVKRSRGPSALNLPPNEKLLEVRSSFIDGISGPVLKSLLDRLLETKVMTDSERESADDMPNKRDKARRVIDTVRRKGEAASSEMIEFLCEADPFLCEHLGLI